MGFWEWISGRDERESDVYANFDKVKVVVDELNTIATKGVGNSQDAIIEAVEKLNKVNGLAEYVGTVQVGNFDSVFDNITSSIKKIASTLQTNADNIKKYEESNWFEKGLSTISMAFCKLGEGLLNIVEDIGDGVVSLVGWVAPKDSGVEKACKSFVEKEWSHDAFNFYYKSDFAQKSAIKEEGALASGLKIVGTTAGYVALTVATAGAGTAAAGAASAASTASKAATVATKVFSGMSKVAKASTWANVGVAALSGMGAGTEAGLLEGKDFDSAALSGAAQGAVRGATAFAAGKFGEYRATKKALTPTNNTQAKNAAKRIAGRSATQAAKETFESVTWKAGKKTANRAITNKVGNVAATALSAGINVAANELRSSNAKNQKTKAAETIKSNQTFISQNNTSINKTQTPKTNKTKTTSQPKQTSQNILKNN